MPAGLEVVQGRFHGQFFSGDCYVVLHGVDRGGVIVHEVFFWLGGESPLSYERDSDIAEVARDFLQSKGLAELPLTLVFQGEETDGFWEYFVNG